MLTFALASLLPLATAWVPAPPCDYDLLPIATTTDSKKRGWLHEKGRRRGVHVSDAQLADTAKAAPGTRLAPTVTLFNLRTKESLAVVPGESIDTRFHLFLRDHFTNQPTRMDVRLIDVLVAAAEKFGAQRIEVVSGFRSPKYNKMLRKKGREVARQSQHTEGHAVDFRIRGVPVQKLLTFVRSLRRGGVGFYPQSQFVHADTGPIRFWKGS